MIGAFFMYCFQRLFSIAL